MAVTRDRGRAGSQIDPRILKGLDLITPVGSPFTIDSMFDSFVFETKGTRTLVIQVLGLIAGTTLVVEGSVNGSNFSGGSIRFSTLAGVVGGTNITADGIYKMSVETPWVRIRPTAFSSGSVVVTAVLREDVAEEPGVSLTNPSITSVSGGNANPVGATPIRIKSAASDNPNLVKGSAGNVYHALLFNTAAAVRFVKFYNKATAPVSTDIPLFTVPVPAGGSVLIELDLPIPFSLGIGYRITAAIGDADVTVIGVDEVQGVIVFA